MNYELIIFVGPVTAMASCALDNGTLIIGHPVVHPSGRRGIGFTIPDGSPNGNGARIVLSSIGKVSINQRGILWLNDGTVEFPWTPNQTAAFETDDFYLQDVYVPPPIPPIPPVPPPVNNDPMSIINNVYANGHYDLNTKDGCGRFTEDCTIALHQKNSIEWGNIRKTGQQNQYNGHAVDACMLLTDSGSTKSGTYDIIVDSEAPGAHPAFNRTDDAHPLLWYYPA